MAHKHSPQLAKTKSKSVNNKNNPRLNRRAKYWPWIFLVLTLLFVAVIRLRLLEIPLERDEGEYAYFGQLMLQGIPPYLMAVNMKVPGIYAVYALIMATFGQTIAGIHLGLLIANCIAIILLFLLTRKLFDDITATVTAAGYAFLSVSPSVLGTQAHATQFIVPLAIGGIIVLLKAIDTKKLIIFFAGGILFGLGFLIKQHTIFFCAFALLYFTLRIINTHPIDWKLLVKGNIMLIIGLSLPFLITCVMLYHVGVFSEFWFWTFTYAREYVSQRSVLENLPLFKANVIRVIDSWWLLWLLSAVGLTAVFWNEKAKRNKIFLISFTIFSFLTVCPGFYFRSHYFVTLLPAVALLAGFSLSAFLEWLSQNAKMPIIKIIPVFAVVVAIIFPILGNSDFFFKVTPVNACRKMYPVQIFPESIIIADYIKARTDKDDRITVIGSEPQIYFYANRKAAASYVYVYALTERHEFASEMQRQMIKEIESSAPPYIVFVDEPTSWIVDLKADLAILDWADKYLAKNYVIVGLLSYNFSDKKYDIYWNEEARNKKPEPILNIYVLKRKL